MIWQKRLGSIFQNQLLNITSECLTTVLLILTSQKVLGRLTDVD